MRNKTRAFLTMLGIIIGISSVIGMISIGQSATENIGDQISSMGTNMVLVQRKSKQQGIKGGVEDIRTLKESDVKAIRKHARYIKMASPMVTTAGQLIYGSHNWAGYVEGGDTDYMEISKYTVASGSCFTTKDVDNAAKVCLVGKTVVDNLFPDGENPVGKTIRFGKIPLKIIGVLESKGQNMMGRDQDNLVIAPFTTVQKRILAINYIYQIRASAVSEEVAEAAAEELTVILRGEHHIQSWDSDDFEVKTQKQFLEMLTSITGMLAVLLTVIAGISLFVGGIGIMNIMYVTVTERTREIGLRMAVGAKNKAILMQFLFESVILCLTGGIVGVLFGLTLAGVASALLMWPFIVSIPTMVVSFLVCAVIGIFFGWYPARKAANLDPINALRYE
jgi:putative ABC transport system permease protein